MSYSFPSRQVFTSSMLGLTDEDLADAAGDFAQWEPGMRIEVREFGFVVTEVVAADVTAPVVSLDHITLPDGTGTRTEKSTITIADTTAVGACVMSTRHQIGATAGLTPFTVEPGEAIVFEHKTQASDAGTASGMGHYYIAYTEKPGEPDNRTLWTEVSS